MPSYRNQSIDLLCWFLYDGKFNWHVSYEAVASRHSGTEFLLKNSQHYQEKPFARVPFRLSSKAKNLNNPGKITRSSHRVCSVKKMFLKVSHISRKKVSHFNKFTGLQLRSSRPDVFCKKRVLKDFAKFTGKHLCQSLFLRRRLQLY